MPIIDCHAHALPNMEQYVEQLPPVLRDIIADKVPFLQNTAKSILDKLPVDVPQIPVDPSRLADLRKNGVGHFLRGIEYLSSFSVAPHTLLQGTVHQLLLSMERSGIKRSVLIAAPPIAPNNWVLQVAKANPEQIIPVCHLPTLPAEAGPVQWRQTFEALVRQGARGFKIHPNFSPFPAHHICHEALFETANRNNLFVIIHTGCFTIPSYANQKPAEPGLFADYFERFPDVRVCLAHMNRDHPQRAWDLMHRYENVYADTSWQTRESIAAAIEAVGNERIVLGSDWPLLNQELQKTNLDAVREATDDSDFEMLTSINALRLIGPG